MVCVLVCGCMCVCVGVWVCVCVCVCEGRGWWGFCCPRRVNRTGADCGVSRREVCRCVRLRVCLCVRAVFKHHLVLERGTSPEEDHNTSAVTVRG